MKPLIWGESKAEYFFAQDWTGEISLKCLRKFRFARGRYCRPSGRWHGAGQLICAASGKSLADRLQIP
jgi:hypothetical protein